VVTTLPFGARASAADQARILRAALNAVRPSVPAAAFDLDGTVLSNKPRQARIVREFGGATGDRRLQRCTPDAIVSWDLCDTARLCGLEAEEAARVEPALRRFWFERFFTSEYCADDVAVPGASAFLAGVLERGGHIVYVTGRHTGMEQGTLAVFRASGFPLPDGDRVQLWLKPQKDDDDDRWKELCHARLGTLTGASVACAFDNEPTHVNAYKRAFPQAHVVHLDTDHSGRPVEVLESVPSVADFRM
jgi:hypothetical protein